MRTDPGVAACQRYIISGRIQAARLSSVWLEVRKMFASSQVKVRQVIS